MDGILQHGKPVYHVEKSRPFNNPPYLIWSSYRIFYNKFIKIS